MSDVRSYFDAAIRDRAPVGVPAVLPTEVTNPRIREHRHPHVVLTDDSRCAESLWTFLH